MNHPPKPPRAKSGMERIRDERERQIKKEGWTESHDDRHDEGELIRAGKAYEAAGDAVAEQRPITLSYEPRHWPWEKCWWKPSASAERNYEKAGALYQAEADRLLRAGKQREAVKAEMEVERVAAKLDQPKGTAPGKKAQPTLRGKAGE